MGFGETTTDEIERVAHEIVDAAFKVHTRLEYDGVRIETGYRIDLIVNDCVLVELKAVEKLIPLYDAQVLTYLKLTGIRLGILINFNTRLIKDGIKRIVR